MLSGTSAHIHLTTTTCHCRAGGGWWWVPIVGPCVGALLGTLIYMLMIEIHHPPVESEPETSFQGEPEFAGSKMGQELEEVETEKRGAD